MLRTTLQVIGIFGFAFLLGGMLYAGSHTPEVVVYNGPRLATSTSEEAIASTSPLAATTSSPKEVKAKKAEIEPQKSQPAAVAASVGTSEEEPDNAVYRIENPYTFPEKDAETLNQEARASLVNIYCDTGSGLVNSISGSGIMIDPRGVVLTNAHVAQYVLIASQPGVELDCYARTGSPAIARRDVDILYMPADWVREHAEDIVKARPRGTGEHDYALLIITENPDGSALRGTFPYLSPDVREAIGFTSDAVLLAGYPAEFSGASKSSLYPSTVLARIGELLTFSERDVDIISLGSVALAQSGSSGGAVVNSWGQLVGLITTTSEGATTAERELRAITLAYINRDIQKTTGLSLFSYIGDDPVAKAANFMATDVPFLANQIIHYLQNR